MERQEFGFGVVEKRVDKEVCGGLNLSSIGLHECCVSLGERGSRLRSHSHNLLEGLLGLLEGE